MYEEYIRYYEKNNCGFGFGDGTCNLAFETVDRPCLNGRENKTALLWSDHTGRSEKFSFSDIARLSGDFAAGLVRMGITRGERVFVYLEKVPEAYVAILGIIKAGAVACPLFSGFGRNALLERIVDAEGSCVISSERSLREITEVARASGCVRSLILTGKSPDGSDADRSPELFSFDSVLCHDDNFEAVRMRPEEPAIIHYTSGTTGRPKGAVHAHRAVLGHFFSTRETFQAVDGEIYWCTADPGWITGTSHGIFGPWSCAMTQAVYCGGYDAGKWCDFMNENGVTIFYTSPTALRQLMKERSVVEKRNFGTLKRIFSVGEPLNPEVIAWARKAFGVEIYDTWFQTETGAITITNRPGIVVKPGSMGVPHATVKAMTLNDSGNEACDGETGDLALVPDMPSFFTGYWKKDEVYKSRFKNGRYLTGDRAWKDADGYYRFVSRNDDVMKVSGHLLGPFEIESALITMPEIAESAVIGIPDNDLQESPMAFIVLKDGITADTALEMKIRALVRTAVAPYAVPRKIKFVEKLPKTRSGKIMRRLLKNRELGLPEGDSSTLDE